jgi:hypothetical protein
MVEKHLDAIRASEEKARDRLAASAREAELMLEKARAEGEKLIENTKISGNELMRALAAGAKEDAGKEIEAMRAEDSKHAAELDEAARRNKEKALELIIRTFRQGL